MQKQQQLYSGKAKSVFETDNKQQLILHFRDDTSAFDGVKVEKLSRKGKVNNYFNAFVMEKLTEANVPNHFEKLLSDDESVVKRLQMIPVECVIRNLVAGSLSKRLGIPEGTELSQPIFEFFFKDDALHDPMINEYHIRAFGWATDAEVQKMKELTFKVNEILKPLFRTSGLLLVDYKLEFGRFNSEVVLGDEITPDGCRIWDAETKEKLDKDRFRRDLGNVVEAYEQVAERLGIVIP
jgi:phosphoribosylaminoimidazole-succinocarboxamide synthase